jgi:DegV family protein with EDD domain
MIGIICDSANDISKENLEKHGIKVAPIRIIIENKEFRDGDEGCLEAVKEYIKDHFVKTTQTAFQDVKDLMKGFIEAGCNEIIGLTMSNQVSGTNNVFQLAAKDIMAENEGVSVEVIDTLSVSMGSGLLTIKAAQLRDEGKAFDDIVRQMKSMVKNNSRIMFVLPTMKYLIMGGRIGKVVGTIVEVLNIKPIVAINEEGIIYTHSKARGIDKATKKMIKEIQNEVDRRKVESLAIVYTGKMPSTMKNVDTIREIFKDKIDTIYFNEINATLWTYAGIGLVGVSILTEYEG